MASFEMAYYAEDDLLEVSFADFDEALSRTIHLNDSITLYADPGLQAVFGLTFYTYTRLLGVSETEFTGLREAPGDDASAVLMLLAARPASCFFDITDPEGLIARVLAPRVEDLLRHTAG